VLMWPFSKEFIVTSPFGPRVHPVTGETGSHRGTDYGTPDGSPIYSPLSGAVSFIGEDDRSGKYIGVKGENYTISFSHMGFILPAEGEIVAQGQALGLSGSTGRVTGPHVHVVVRDKRGDRIDPETVIIPPSAEEASAAPLIALIAAGALL
jgi:murein DD-endopeptidase